MNADEVKYQNPDLSDAEIDGILQGLADVAAGHVDEYEFG